MLAPDRQAGSRRTSYQEDVNDRNPEIMLAKAEIARTREAVVRSVLALQQEIARAFDWREWVGRRPVTAVILALAVGGLIGLVHVNVQRERE